MTTETKPTKTKKTKSKKNKNSSEVEVNEVEETKRSSTPPKKSQGKDAWFDWYRDEIRDKIANGDTFDSIKKSLNITHVEKFLNNER